MTKSKEHAEALARELAVEVRTEVPDLSSDALARLTDRFRAALDAAAGTATEADRRLRRPGGWN